MKKWTVYIPFEGSEVYPDIEAESEKEAIEKVMKGQTQHCIGTFVTGLEKVGMRAVPIMEIKK